MVTLSEADKKLQKKLTQEAVDWIEFSKKKMTPNQKTAFRFYLGNALGGLVASGPSRADPKEIAEQAAQYALAAMKVEDRY